MKRGIKTLLLLGLFGPLVANAASVTLDCPSTIKAGSDVTCSIKLTSEEVVDGFEAKINASSGLTYKGYIKTKGWSGTSSSSAFLVFGYVDENDTPIGVKGKNIVLGTYTYTVGSAATGDLTLSISDIVVSDKNGEQLSSNPTAADIIRVASTVNTLSSLSINGATIDFSSDVTTYNVTIDAATATISATATDSYAKVIGTGNKNLNYGSNKFDIVVTSESGDKKTYTINVTRPDNRSTDNTLKELKLNNGTINFKSGTTTYNVTIDASETIISATANDVKAKITGTGNKTIKYGTNKFEVVVTAENGSTKTYTINVTRPDNRSSNNNLSSLTLSTGKITFDKNKTNYEISVKNEITEITINGKVEDDKSKVEGFGTKTLQVGENTFIIKVTAENESIKEYKIVVIRNKEEVVTVNNNIKSLSIEGHSIEFNPETKNYTIKTDKSLLNINVELENPTSRYEIIGNKDLEDGSIIQIVVTDKDGNNNIYSITVEKIALEDVHDTNYIPIIMVSILGILIVANIYLFVMQLRRNKK